MTKNDDEYKRIKAEIEKRQKNALMCLHTLINSPISKYSAVEFEKTKTHLHNICEGYSEILSCLNRELDWSKLSYETLVKDLKICYLKREIAKLELTRDLLADFSREFTGGMTNGTIRH